MAVDLGVSLQHADCVTLLRLAQLAEEEVFFFFFFFFFCCCFFSFVFVCLFL